MLMLRGLRVRFMGNFVMLYFIIHFQFFSDVVDVEGLNAVDLFKNLIFKLSSIVL